MNGKKKKKNLAFNINCGFSVGIEMKMKKKDKNKDFARLNVVKFHSEMLESFTISCKETLSKTIKRYILK